MAKPKELDKLKPKDQLRLVKQLVAKQAKKQGTGGKS